jgi:hypothetical protein
MFTSVADLRILSSALALFITRAGNRVRERPENPEVIRARQLMDHVDDRLYLPPPCSMTPVKPPRHLLLRSHLVLHITHAAAISTASQAFASG